MGDASATLNSYMTMITPTEQVPLLPAAITPPLPGTNSALNSNSTSTLPRGRTRSQRGSQRTTLNVRNLSLNRNAMTEGIPPDQTVVEQIRSKPNGQGGPVTWQRTPDGGSAMAGSSLQAAQAYLNNRTDAISPGPTPAPEDSLDFDWSDLLGMDISEAMWRKAMLDFGLEVSLTR